MEAAAAYMPTDEVDELAIGLRRLIAFADRERDHVPDSLAQRIRLQFAELAVTFDRVTREMPGEAAALGARVRGHISGLVRRSEHGRRWLVKPRGHAGDHATIARIYSAEAIGTTACDRVIDRCFLDLPLVFAFQHRRDYLARALRTLIRASAPSGPARVTGFACGPACELFDGVEFLDDPHAFEATLLDFDRDALRHCAREAARCAITERITLADANRIHLATGRQALPLAPQDLVYSLGLVDYLADDDAVKLLDWMYAALRPGGRAIVGAIHASNPSRAIMDHVLDWRMVHRDEAALNALVCRSAFGTACITFEQGIVMFAELAKAC
jgi:SAM-dependent methyltransferase